MQTLDVDMFFVEELQAETFDFSQILLILFHLFCLC